MRVARLKIEGFRGANSADIQLSPHSVLIGPNNSGKFLYPQTYPRKGRKGLV